MNSPNKNFYTIFGEINGRQNEILKNDYVYKTFYEVDFKKCLRPNLFFRTSISQKVLPNKNFFVSNRGFLSFFFKTDFIELSKKFDTDGNLKINILYNFQKIFSQNGFLFAKFLSNHSESKILPKIGVKLRTPHLRAEGNYDFDKTAFSNKIIWTLPRNRNESEIEYFGCAVAFCSNLKYFSMYKTILYYQSNDLDVSLSHENPERNDNSIKKINFSVFNKAKDNLDIALMFKYNATADKHFKIILGGNTSLSKNVVCKGKIDDNFNVASSLLITLCENIKLLLSTHFTLNTNPKKDYLPHLPFGFKLLISD